jgi:dTDP-4-amino-4,6-dideoxygalactose transaminase
MSSKRARAARTALAVVASDRRQASLRDMPATMNRNPEAISKPAHIMKVIRSAKDLAINGAPPTFAEPLHVGRPNIGDHERFLQRAAEILNRGWLSNNGPVAQEFERKIAGFLGVKHCVAMCNGTIALEIATRALNLKGEVIVPSYTFIATAHALQWQEITPIFADIDPQTHNLDPAAVRRMITPRTTGIIGVHLWGRAAPVAELQAIADEHHLRLMFDASHGFGCSLGGKLLGSFGECEVFSFHATKFFNTFEGGAVVTSDDALAEKMRLMRNFGFSGYDNVIYPGTNGKLAEISAAMGLTNLESLDSFVAINRRNYETYRDGIASLSGLNLLRYDESQANNFQYIVVEVGTDFPVSRDRIVETLHAENVLARKYFWPGCHNMEPYRSYYPHAGLVLPNTDRVSERVVVLPTGSAISVGEIRGVLAILQALASAAQGNIQVP